MWIFWSTQTPHTGRKQRERANTSLKRLQNILRILQYDKPQYRKNLWSAFVEFKKKAWNDMNSRSINTLQPETTTKSWQNAAMLEANVSSSHAVSQFVPVSKEGHEAYVSLDWDVLIQHQDAIGLPGNWLHGVDLLGCIPELLTKFLDLWERRWKRKHISSFLLLEMNVVLALLVFTLKGLWKAGFILFCWNRINSELLEQ